MSLETLKDISLVYGRVEAEIEELDVKSEELNTSEKSQAVKDAIMF